VSDPNKPKGKLCRLAALMRWTGWNEKEIYFLVSSGQLRVWHLRLNGYQRKYYVDSAQEILDRGFGVVEKQKAGEKLKAESRNAAVDTKRTRRAAA
jgi:hypothetical protein